MAEKSKIAWCDNTANFWWGCIKVDQGCEHCYAETLSKRIGKQIWGPAATTDREEKKAIWKEIIKWDKRAGAEGIRLKVFVMSMGDFLEAHPGLHDIRERAKDVMVSLEHTDIQMLTKRPENAPIFLSDWMVDWPKHIWFGTSVASQKDTPRIIDLMKIPAPILWLSVEPMIGPVDLMNIQYQEFSVDCLRATYRWKYKPEMTEAAFQHAWEIDPERAAAHNRVKWVIVGGESGGNCRPFDPAWARLLRDQCDAAAVPFFMKQLGGHPDKRDDPDQFPEDLRIREFPPFYSVGGEL